MRTRLPRTGSGISGMGGIWATTSAVFEASGSSSAHSRYTAIASAARATSNIAIPA